MTRRVNLRATVTRPSTDIAIDAFASRYLANSRPRLLAEQVPVGLRAGPVDADGTVDWTILRIDSAPWIESLEARLPRRFPPSFRSLVIRYAFPAFDLGPVHLFANTGELDMDEELGSRLFADPVLSAVLLANGFVQIGRPAEWSYDPVCFDTNVRRGGGESPVVQLDHEEVLRFGRIRVERTIAGSFLELIEGS